MGLLTETPGMTSDLDLTSVQSAATMTTMNGIATDNFILVVFIIQEFQV